MEWTAVSKKRRVGQPVQEPMEVSMDSRGKDPCWNVCCRARGLSHRAGNPCRAAPEVPLGEAWQEERGEWQRSSHGKGREIPSVISRNSIP